MISRVSILLLAVSFLVSCNDRSNTVRELGPRELTPRQQDMLHVLILSIYKQTPELGSIERVEDFLNPQMDFARPVVYVQRIPEKRIDKVRRAIEEKTRELAVDIQYESRAERLSIAEFEVSISQGGLSLVEIIPASIALEPTSMR